MMKRTISGMTGTGSLAHNRRDFFAENVNPNRVYLNICYWDENLKDVYKELFDESVERYNVGKRNDRKITNYYDKIQHGKQLSVSFAYRVVERMNADLASKNYYVILGQVPTRYVEDKIYGLEHVEQYLKEDKAI